MSVSATKTVRELAAENAAAPRVFEKFGIDYCCGGSSSLEVACRQRNLSVDQVLKSLESAESAEQFAPGGRNWLAEPLADLIHHIKVTHHKYTSDEIARLGPLLEKVVGKHGKNHPELLRIQQTFAGLAQELASHLMKEEMVLFPYIERLEESVIQKERVIPAPFGSVGNPVSMMMHEHDSAGSALRDMREAAGDYSAPADACPSYQSLYRALGEFEADLHQHIHLENNILFPRAIRLEQGAQSL